MQIEDFLQTKATEDTSEHNASVSAGEAEAIVEKLAKMRKGHLFI